MFDIFISYRRSDSRADAGRLYDRLSAYFGDDDVFMDIDDIESGQDFVEVLANTLDRCGAMLVILGKDWLDVRNESGGRRIDDKDDFVRIEIQRAIDRDIHIVPVLVGGATMPDVKELPAALAAFGRYQAHDVSDTRFHQDVDRLIEGLEAFASNGPTRKVRKRKLLRRAAVAALIALLVLVPGGLYLHKASSDRKAASRHVSVGEQHAAAGDLREAGEAYRKALAIEPDSVAIWRRLVAAGRDRLLREWIATDSPSRLLGVNTRRRIAPPVDDSEQQAVLADIYATRALDEALDDDVDLLRAEAAVFIAGVANADRSLPYLERALDIDASRIDVSAELGLMRALLSDDRSGVELVRASATREPDNARWQFYLAEALSAHHVCNLAGADSPNPGGAGGCADAIRAYRRAIDLTTDDAYWSRVIRHYSIAGSFAIFHRYANKERDMLTPRLDMPLDERIRVLEFLLPLENNRSRSGWHDYPHYWMAVLYEASDEPDKAIGHMRELFAQHGEKVAEWLALYVRVLEQAGGDDGELARIQALLEQERQAAR